ncbi:RNA polymerase factor sigma-54 [Trichococcus collinsii]|uniref:RNA polymerase, sigma 54 subunit, RpoN/SigL n=1 Tax=Trichococcus collinsii TaxID=157076 RepID=A0AB38A3P1_9LACT|nr:RNA polymerase factor sigma-54 [Trichococcus collinsii]CZQ99248.1 rna polymerase sigma factor 54 [Trichococcus collinsii]SEA92962.1 RNA polymerase, sigma 54 subunit, RpoN/SigL [Trichococcus collinsii]
MKQKLGLSNVQTQTQKIRLSQEMKQSIELLQYNKDQLQEFLRNKVLENPLLEISEPVIGSFSGLHSHGRMDDYDPLVQLSDGTISFYDIVIRQIHMNYRDTYLRKLILFLVNHLDENGFLSVSLQEAEKMTGGTGIELLDALTLLQQLEPAGVGARDMRECFMLQCERNESAPALAYFILEEYYELLMKRKWEEIANQTNISLKEIQIIFDFVGNLYTSPAKSMESGQMEYVVPDLSVKVEDDEITLKENRGAQTKIKLNVAYLRTLREINDQETKKYLNEKEKEVHWLEMVIAKRASTIFRVGEFIIKYQEDFFLKPEHPIKSLKLSDAATDLSLHESTISRAVNGKYLETNFGIFELKTFFSNNAVKGEDISSQQIKIRIKQLISEENPAKPFSDSKLVKMLEKDQIPISRRTIAKYRDSLGILPSSKRKRYE